MNETCPSCGRKIAEADGRELTEDRSVCNGGAGDVCSDGKLHCLDCLSSNKCGCG